MFSIHMIIKSFGPDYLATPVLSLDITERNVYLPSGKWKDMRDDSILDGGKIIDAPAPVDPIPVNQK